MSERNIVANKIERERERGRERVKNSRSKTFFLTVIILSVILFTYQPALAAESSSKPTSFISYTYTLASVGSFFRSFIFSDKKEENTDKEQPTFSFSYTREETNKLIKEETKSVKQEVEDLANKLKQVKPTSFISYTLASAGSFFRSFIFSDKKEENTDKEQPTFSYTREETNKLVKDETENIKKESQALKQELSNLKQEVTNLDRTQTVINQPVIERVVTQAAPASGQPSEGKVIYTYDASVITQDQLEEKLNNLNTSLLNRISQTEAQANTQTTAVYRAVSLTNKIDNLSNITVSGVTGLTDTDIPNDITASNYLPLSGGTMTGTLIGAALTLSSQITVSGNATSTLAGDTDFDSGTLYIDSINNRVGIASSSPSETLSVNGAAYFSQISAPSNTIDRLYNDSGDLYWNGNLIGSASVGNWTSLDGNAYRSSGNVGIGTTTPSWKLSVAGIGSFDNYARASYFTATSSTASTFPYASTTALTVSGPAYLGSLNGPLQANNGLVSATTSVGYEYGGTGLTAAPSFGQLLRGTGSGYALVATSTLGISTTDLTEGSNLFWTNDRFDTRLSATTTLPNLTTLANLATVGTITSGAWSGTTIAVNKGGTGLTSYTLGDVLYASGTGTLAGTTTANLKTTLALNNVENTALSTWAGTSNITTLGTIGTGVWNATTIGVSKGGTGATTFTNNRLLTGNSTSALVDEANLTFDGSLLTVTGNASTTQIGSTGSAYFATTGGNVGIGTTAPGQKLTVVGGNENVFTTNITKAAGVDAQINGVGSLDVAFTGDGAAGVNGAYSYYGARINNSFVSSDNTGVATNIGLQVDVSGGDNNYGLIVGSGNVGIGTTTPGAKLHTLSTTEQLRLGYDASNYWSSTVGSTGGLTLAGTGAGGALSLTPTAGQNLNVNLSGAGDLAVNTNQLYVDTSTGNVGIGTTTPSWKLSVAGIGSFDNYARASYFTATSSTASTFPYASTTALTVSGPAYLGSLNGPLQANNGLVSATTSVGYEYGGTGLTAAPSFGQLLRGTGSGYALVATSTLGINTTDLTEGSNLFWTNDRFDTRLSATTTLPNLTTLANLATVGTITSGNWSGSTIAVNKGGTGQTSFGQGWLNSDGTTLSASSSPTVNYIVATSTTATNTFAGGMSVAGTAGLTVLQNGNVGIGTATPVSKFVVNGGDVKLNTDYAIGNVNLVLNSNNSAHYLTLTSGVGQQHITATNGVLMLNSTGNSVAIGAGYPAGGNPNKLNVSGGLSIGAGYFSTSAVAPTNGAIIEGNVGIGTTSPYAKLSIVGETVSSYFTATSTTATSTFPYLRVTTNSNLGTIIGGVWNGTTIGDAYLTKSGDWTGTLDGQEGSYYSNANNLTNFGNPFYTFFSATNTDALTEGSSNKYYSTLLFSSDMAGTTTDALAQGSTNKYWSNTLFDNRLSATTTLPNLTTLLGLTNATTTGLTVTGNAYFPGSGIWNSSGNVGIGTTTPGAKLDVNGNIYLNGNMEIRRSSTGENALEFYIYTDGASLIDSLTGNLNIRASGGNSVNFPSDNVGIGTTTPGAKLHTLSTTEQLRLGYDASNYWSGTVGSTGGLTLAGTGAGGSLALTPTAGQNLNVNLSGAGDLAVNTNQLYVDTSTGNVGIGTTNPGAKLELQTGAADSSGATTGLIVANNYSRQVNDAVQILLSPTPGSGSYGGYMRLTNTQATPAVLNPRIGFYINNDGMSSELLSIKHTGNVGIGTTTPYAKLSVVGETVSSYFTATTSTASTFPYASTTALTVSGSAYLGSLNGPLQANNGLVSATTSVGYEYGGTGLTVAPSFGQILRGTGSGYALVATSTLGINTTDLTEGSNLFWTNNRFDTRLSATTTLPNLTTLLGLTNATTTGLTVTGNAYFPGSGIWNSSGNVGIGTTTPATKLSIAQSADSNGLRIYGYDDQSGKYGDINIGTTGELNIDSTNQINILEEVYLFGSFINIQNNNQIGFGNGNDYSVGYQSSSDKLFIQDGAILGTNVRLAIDNTGNVGIGTTAPGKKLHVVGAERVDYAATSADDLNIVLYDTTAYAAGVGAGISFAGEYDTGAYEQYAAIKGLKANATINDRKGQLAFYTSASSGVTTERMRIDELGNVGIGTTAPGSPLTVKNPSGVNTAFQIWNNDYVGGSAGSGMYMGLGATSGSTYFQIQPFMVGNTQYGNLVLNPGGGNVGIGTTSPYAKLSVVGETVSSYFTATSTTTASTFLYASSTALTISGNSYLGTVSSGTWNGSLIGDTYIDDTITLTNLTQITNRAITDTTGTLTVARGGTGQTSFGQGWLHSDGTTLSASTSPTVAYFTATSTTATSTFAGDINIGSTSNWFQNGQRFLTSSTTDAGNLTIGYQSATNIDANGGLGNTGVGYQALGNATSTDYNTALGYQALLGDGTISNVGSSTAVGYKALKNNTRGNQNTAVGAGALYSNTTGNVNDAFGHSALYSNTTGAVNVAFGHMALYSNTTGTYNTAVGDGAMMSQTTAERNTGLGLSTLERNTTGSYNAAVGDAVLYNNSSATSTTAIGYRTAFGPSIYSNQGGVYLGYQSGYSAGNASDYNTLLGYRAGYGVTTGSNNIILGTATSSTGVNNLTTGSQNILIGNNIGLPSSTASGQLNIGNLIFGTGITGTGTTLSAGNIGIGTTSPYAKLSVVGETVSSYFTATSTTATSTFAGGMSVAGTAGLTVLQNGDVGIGGVPNSGAMLTIAQDADYKGLRIYGYDDKSTQYGNIYVGAAGEFSIDSTAQINLNRETYLLGSFLNINSNKLLGFGNSNDYTMGYQSSSGKLFLQAGPTIGTNVRLAIDTTGNVGIGTTSPYAKLSIVGETVSSYFTATSTTATSTFAGGMSVAGSSGLTVLQNGNVGVGTTTPSNAFQIVRANEAGLLLKSGGSEIKFSAHSQYGRAMRLEFFDTASRKWWLGMDNAGALVDDFIIAQVVNPAAPEFIIKTSGNIGIGTTSPWSLLSLKGSSGAQMTIAQADTNYTQLTVDASGNLTFTPSGSTITIPDDNLKVCAGDACQTTALNSGNGNLTVENNIEIGGSYNRTCATGYIWVPGSAKFGTLPGFCVMKYEAKNDGSGNAVSTATGGPYVSIDQPTSITKCEAIGLGYHLISESEWMTIAENIAQTPINDMDDDAGLQLATGHSDNAPASALAATSASDPVVSGCNLSATMENAANAYSASSCEIQGDGSYGGDDTDKGFYGTSQAWATTGYSSGAANKAQLRTHILSNGNVIWDIAGNVFEWTDAYVNGTAEKPASATDAWQDFSAITNYITLNYARPQNPSWSSANGIGQYYGGTSAGQRGFLRGGRWLSGAGGGVFALYLGDAPSNADTYIGFRCSR
ncbi:TPA: hypothetical protein DCZ57_00960 [Patescibacteria group bacterium]|nr:hypothetical protein [Patescibacteria group bacterium]